MGPALDARGMVMDFSDLKRAVGGWIDSTLDHTMLLRNDDPVLADLQKRGERVHGVLCGAAHCAVRGKLGKRAS